MKRVALISAACVALATPAFATDLTYDCRNGVQKFYRHGEARDSKRDPDPVYKILVHIWDDDGDGLSHMSIAHVTESERRISRAEQYPINGLTIGMDSWVWKGRYDRDPSIYMVGSLRRDHSGTTYTESRYRDHMLEWSNRTRCHVVR